MINVAVRASLSRKCIFLVALHGWRDNEIKNTLQATHFEIKITEYKTAKVLDWGIHKTTLSRLVLKWRSIQWQRTETREGVLANYWAACSSSAVRYKGFPSSLFKTKGEWGIREQKRQEDVMVFWCTGVLVCWCTAVLVYWCTGVLVCWFAGVLVYWCTGVPAEQLGRPLLPSSRACWACARSPWPGSPWNITTSNFSTKLPKKCYRKFSLTLNRLSTRCRA